MSEVNETESEEVGTAMVPLSKDQLAALIPASADAFLHPVGANSAPAEQRGSGFSVPYIAFRGLKSNKNVEALTAAGITVSRDGDGTFYLMDPPVPIRVDPFEFHLLQYHRAFTRQDNKMKVTDAILKSDNDAFAEGYREHIFGTAIVKLPGGGYRAATLNLRGPQVNALRDAVRLLDHPGKMVGNAYAHLSEVKAPGLKFRITIWSTLEQPKDPRAEKFNDGHGTTRPTPKEDIYNLLDYVRTAFDTEIKPVSFITNAKFEQVRLLALRQAAAQPVETSADPIPF